MKKLLFAVLLLYGCAYNPNWARDLATDPAFQTGLGLMRQQNQMDQNAAYINYMNRPTVCQELPNGTVICQ